MKARGLIALLACACAADHSYDGPPGGERPGCEPALRWNELVLEVAEEEDGLLTLRGVRAVAMVHLAMHDALNAVEPRFASRVLDDTAPDADAVRAACRAAFEVASALYPGRAERFAAELRLVPGAAGSVARSDALGRAAAAAVLGQREGDRWDAEAEYTWHPMGPGVYAEFSEHSATPQGFVFGAGWARARPFVLERPDAFRSPPPPEILSDAYARAFDEVKELGRRDSETRTADQTHLAMWWKDFVERSHSRLGRELAAEAGLDLWEATRMFALLGMAVYDAYVNVFDNKFHYNHWRPYTAIRWAEHDGNPRTLAEEGWTNTHDHTYAFPSYPSAHGCASAAAMEVLRACLGDRAFTMRTPEVDRGGPFSGKVAMDPPERTFAGFREAALECAMSRVYLGIHFRYDSVEGNRLGAAIGRHVVAGVLRAVP